MGLAILAYFLAATAFYILLMHYSEELYGPQVAAYCVVAAVLSVFWPLSLVYGMILVRKKET